MRSFKELEPKMPFRLEKFFPGRCKVYGVFQDRFGRPRRQLTARIDSTFESGLLTLDEHFTYDDGLKERRIWRIHPEGEGYYRATADGVIGEAAASEENGMIRWRYAFELDLGPYSLNVQFDDWMCQQNPTLVISRAMVSKWGIRLGDLTLVFQKQPASGGA